MIGRAATVGALLMAALLAQTALFPLLPTAWFRPDLLLLVAVAFGLADGPLPGLRVGFVAGLLTDLFVALVPLGIATLVVSVVGFAVGSVRPFLAPSSLSAPLAVAFGASVVATGAYGTLALLLGDDRVTVAMIAQAALAVAIYNTLLAAPLMALARVVVGRFPRVHSAPIE
jgi:rod shape-determining protein MreD